MLATVIRDERYAVVIAIAKEHDYLPESTVYCLKICDFKGDEPIRIEGVPFILDDYNNGSPIWEDFCLRSQSIEVGSIIKVENRRDWYVGNTGKKMAMKNILSQLRFGNGNHGVAFRGIKEAFPDAVVAPDGIYQDTKPRCPYALISVVSGFTGNDHQLSTLTRLEEKISLKNHSHGQLSIKQGFFQVQEQLLSKDDVGDVILVAFGSTTFLGLKYQAICMGLLSSGTGQSEKTLTGVILAVSKQDESSSMIYARQVDSDFNGNGQPFQLWNKNGSVWQNEYLSAEKLAFGSLVTFKKYHGFSCVYCNKVDVKPQDVTKIQMDLDDTECIFLGISDAFPKAKIHTKGLSMDEMPTPCIAAIGMKSAHIKNERIEFTSCRGEQVSVKLLCREHLQLSASTIELQLRSSSDSLQDVALVKFVKTQHSLRHPTYSAVCVGLLLKFSPTVISITEEPVEIQHGNGSWMLVPGEVLFDTGNEMATGISEKLVDELDLQPDRRKLRKVVCGGGKEFHCSRVAIEIEVRGHKFKVDNALVGAPAPNTDLLIGKDVIDQLFKRKYTFGE